MKYIAALENKFDKELRRMAQRVISETGYRPERFIQMRNQYGGLKTAKILLQEKTLSEGFVKLWELRRLDLTMEAIIIKKPWRELFTDKEIRIAKNRLNELGYPIPENE
jgi:hypothetical protein